ncbi:hypothetical protein Nepgr_024831 [Nepenthes gracilis]|uniref:Uncharacterized protein n=1 Tax=Nepenthes gracilis TaxID=150966 RepID=A0AAD3T4X4_NEPGR|nr:hypothetical protein Nepgr_024831 [Nepenthes gracilis]
MEKETELSPLTLHVTFSLAIFLFSTPAKAGFLSGSDGLNRSLALNFLPSTSSNASMKITKSGMQKMTPGSNHLISWRSYLSGPEGIERRTGKNFKMNIAYVGQSGERETALQKE